MENYDDIEKAIEEFLARWKLKNDTTKKDVRSVSQGGDRESDSLLGSINWQWCEYYGDCVATKPINVAIKRFRADDGSNDDAMPDAVKEDAPPGKAGSKASKAKGKGLMGA